MDKKDLRIVFMGTPEFAVESLRRLVEGGYNVVAVVTQLINRSADMALCCVLLKLRNMLCRSGCRCCNL